MIAPSLIKQTHNGEYCLSGELVRDTVPSFWCCRAKWLPNDENVHLDLSALERVDSAGMALLLHLQHKLKMNKQNLTIHNIPPQLTLLLELSQVTDLFMSTAPSVDGE